MKIKRTIRVGWTGLLINGKKYFKIFVGLLSLSVLMKWAMLRRLSLKFESREREFLGQQTPFQGPQLSLSNEVAYRVLSKIKKLFLRTNGTEE